MQSRNYNNFQTRIRSIKTVGELSKQEEDNGIRKDIKQNTNNECRDSKDNI